MSLLRCLTGHIKRWSRVSSMCYRAIPGPNHGNQWPVSLRHGRRVPAPFISLSHRFSPSEDFVFPPACPLLKGARVPCGRLCEDEIWEPCSSGALQTPHWVIREHRAPHQHTECDRAPAGHKKAHQKGGQDTAGSSAQTFGGRRATCSLQLSPSPSVTEGLNLGAVTLGSR